MSETWISDGLCRCCHSKGHFNSLAAYTGEEREDTYSVIIHQTFNIIVSKYSFIVRNLVLDIPRRLIFHFRYINHSYLTIFPNDTNSVSYYLSS